MPSPLVTPSLAPWVPQIAVSAALSAFNQKVTVLKTVTTFGPTTVLGGSPVNAVGTVNKVGSQGDTVTLTVAPVYVANDQIQTQGTPPDFGGEKVTVVIDKVAQVSRKMNPVAAVTVDSAMIELNAESMVKAAINQVASEIFKLLHSFDICVAVPAPPLNPNYAAYARPAATGHSFLDTCGIETEGGKFSPSPEIQSGIIAAGLADKDNIKGNLASVGIGLAPASRVPKSVPALGEVVSDEDGSTLNKEYTLTRSDLPSDVLRPAGRLTVKSDVDAGESSVALDGGGILKSVKVNKNDVFYFAEDGKTEKIDYRFPYAAMSEAKADAGSDLTLTISPKIRHGLLAGSHVAWKTYARNFWWRGSAADVSSFYHPSSVVVVFANMSSPTAPPETYHAGVDESTGTSFRVRYFVDNYGQEWLVLETFYGLAIVNPWSCVNVLTKKDSY